MNLFLFIQVPLNQIPKMEIYDLIRRVEKCYSESLLKIKKWCGSHPVLMEELDNEEYGESTRKHFLQQVRCSLVLRPMSLTSLDILLLPAISLMNIPITE